MSTWIEEAEKRQALKKKEAILEQISDNQVINQNHHDLKPFVKELQKLVERVAQISPDERKPSMEIGFTHLDGDHQYEFYGSAFIMKSRRRLLFFPVKSMYVCWRRIFLKVPDDAGKVKLVTYEKMTNQSNKKDNKKKRVKYKFLISDLNEKIAYKILDWVAFRIDTSVMKKYLPHDHGD